jgi:tRNA A-37 threonylcarbamoyl transferase component Bud32/tetratricopeptide (TPR) repeat protein
LRTLIEDLFNAVADLPKEARDQYFAEHHIDAATRKEVEALLGFDSDASGALEIQIGAVAERALARLDPRDIPCGPFRIGALLGRGGMGAVYSAERVDGEVSHRVAIKLLRPGADDPQLRRRFLAERQILATLSHPHIARLLDAGHRDDGQPYLVMEYVKGESIDVYTSQMSVRQKLALFLKVCVAVSYLHRNLVVHRDLKPSNILVNEEGEPKLLDFGLAKMLDLTTDSTVTSMRMLTPDYASPEQVIGGPVTTATDIYSLGAVLYKLLTDECPHKFESNSAAGIALTVSTGKVVPPSKLVPAIKSDLEMVVMKALRKEPQERYSTIDQFSEDLENFLESRPIRARRGDTWYRTRKFMHRHWLPAAAVAIAMAGLLTGLAMLNRERATAQRRFLEVRSLANKLFDIDAEASKLSGSTKTRGLIVGTSLEYLRRLSGDARKDPELALEVGSAYMRVARVQGVTGASNLGQVEQAKENLRIAEGFILSVVASQPSNRAALLTAAQIAHDRMLIARSESRNDEALMFARKSSEWLERFHAEKGDESESTVILTTYLNVADQHMYGQQFEDALRLTRTANEIAETFHNPAQGGALHWVSAEVFRRRGDLDEALGEIRESVRMLDPSAGEPDARRRMNYILALIREGLILGEDNAISLGRPDQAADVLAQSFDLADGFVHKDTSDQLPRGRLAMAGVALANITRHSEPRRALDIYDHTLRHLGEIKDSPSFRRYEVSSLAGSSYVLRRLGKVGEARQRLDLAFERLRQIGDYPTERIKPGSEAAIALSALADHEAATHNIPRAIEIYMQLLSKIGAYGPKQETYLVDAVEMSNLYGALADLHQRSGHAENGSNFRAQRVELWRHWDARLPHNSFVHRQLNAANILPAASRQRS